MTAPDRPTETLVNYAINVTYEDIPKEVIERSKIYILDAIGCGLGGFDTELGRVVIKTVKQLGGNPESTIIGDGCKVGCVQAAFANAAVVNALDFDDTHDGGAIAHPGATMIPAALAVGELLEVSGKDFVTAIIVGYEVALRIGLAIQPSVERAEKILSVGAWQTFGAVTTASKLFGLNEYETENAFGIAGSFSPVSAHHKIYEKPMSWGKDMVHWPSAVGVLAALLAKNGFVGPRRILDGEKGYWIMFGSDRCNFDKMVENLGTEYKIIKNSVKPYSACRFIHPILDSVKAILNEHRLKPEDINTITVKSMNFMPDLFLEYRPADLAGAQFSVPYCVAMVVRGETPGPNWFTKDKFKDPGILNLADKVKLEPYDESDKSRYEGSYYERRHLLLPVQVPFSQVEIITDARRRYTHSVELGHAKGSPANPLTDEEVRRKFLNLSLNILEEKQAREIIMAIGKLEDLSNIRGLADLLYPRTKPRTLK